MDVSGGSGQPRSGNDEPAQHSADPTAPATDHPGPEPEPPRPADRAEAGTEEPAPTPTGRDGATDRPAEEATAGRTDTDGTGDGNSTDDRTGGSTTAEVDAAPTPDAAAGSDAAATPGPADTPGTPAPAEPDHRAPDDTPRRDPAPPPAHHAAAPEHRSLAHSGIAKGEPPEPRPKEPGGGILMGRPFGVPVYVAPSWFLVAALITWVFGGQLDRVLPELGAARYLVSLFFAVAFYASVLVHELAHTVAAIRFKLPVRRIQLQFFGGVSEIEKEAETPGREFVLAFVGPLLSLALAGLFYLAMKPVEPGTVPGVLLAGLMVSNLIVAIFNLLPGLPLDGGRMLRAVVWKISGKPMTGTVAAAWVGRALAVSVLIGLPLLNQSGALGGGGEDVGGMDTVTDALLAAILAAIIWTGAGNSLRMARLREHLPELRARTLTRRAVPVENDTPLSEALRRANAAGARALVVVDPDGQPLSLVREAAIVGVPEHRRPWVAVSGLAQELTDGMRVSAELAGEELLDVLRATPATEYLVVEETGEIYGVLSAADVERAFVRAMARPA
ncbi:MULTISPECIES: site-2 protease family protein [Streptomyces]|uniref:site-2 protease family protein n=1 Tax=Streptomyces TaxID=1883 RepID=UPI0004BDA5A7|nr:MULTISPECIES: site-2 protease family protein [Streptomyces]KMS89384.1 peptidase [Streptomyces regensis]KOG63615.1 peptidase [Streptomyces antibioticus]